MLVRNNYNIEIHNINCTPAQQIVATTGSLGNNGKILTQTQMGIRWKKKKKRKDIITDLHRIATISAHKEKIPIQLVGFRHS